MHNNQLLNNGIAGAQIQDWRNSAIDMALEAGIHYDEGQQILLREIRRYAPDCTIFSVFPDRTRLVRFLEEKTQNMRSLLPGQTYSWANQEETKPILGWYAIEWESHTIEIALSPNYGTGEIFCIGTDKTVLGRFVQAMTDFAMRPTGRCLRYTEGWEEAPDLEAEMNHVTWADIVLPPETLLRLREAIEGFFEHRDSFAAFGFPWKRGVLLIGPPGTGKTMVCKATAAALPTLPFLYVRDIREHRHQDAIKAIFDRARLLAPCILAFEDMDGFINEHNRTLFLNEMDGFGNNNGLLVIASSNHPGKIDEALLKRPSRFDRVFQIGLPGLAERREYCHRLLSRGTLSSRLAPTLKADELATQAAERSEGFTPAYLKEAFIAAALQQAQKGAVTLDTEFAASVLEQIEELRAHLKRMRDPDALAEMSTGDAMGFR